MQYLVSGLSFQQLLEGILNKALCQHLRRVIGCGLFPLPPGKTIDKGAFFVFAQLPVTVTCTLRFGIVVKLPLRHEISDIQLVYLVALTFDLKKRLLRNETTVAEQSLVHRAHLVDAESGI